MGCMGCMGMGIMPHSLGSLQCVQDFEPSIVSCAVQGPQGAAHSSRGIGPPLDAGRDLYSVHSRATFL